MENALHTDRRSFLKSAVATAAAAGVGLAIVGGSAMPAFAADAGEVSMPGNVKPVPTGDLFSKGVIGPAELSLATSKIAVEKATQKNAKEFAGFELTEAIAVTTVLKSMNTPVPPPDATAKAILAKLQAAPKGPEFDKAYIKAQLENHVFLRNHATDYLKQSVGATDAMEVHARHLATLALATFEEHVAICTRIAGELGA